jgi:hypothetical protein
MIVNPFFRSKIGHVKATVRASIDVKTGSPDPVDFAKYSMQHPPFLWLCTAAYIQQYYYILKKDNF